MPRHYFALNYIAVRCDQLELMLKS